MENMKLIVESYFTAIEGKDVFLELRVNPEAPTLVITGISLQITWAGNGYFRATVNGEYQRDITSENAFEVIEHYIREEINLNVS